MDGLTDDLVVTGLAEADCWALLGSASFGRLCSADEEAVAVVPTTYALRGAGLYLRAPAFGPVARRGRVRPVTLQVDDARDGRPPGWSVTASGPVSRVEDAATLASLWSSPRPRAWEDGLTSQWLSLHVQTVRGRRVRAGA